ncbi:MAG: hypothetical protein ACJ77A_04080 [Actinomycetota bacterium]
MRESLDDHLRSVGIIVDEVLTVGAPVQVIGRLPTGERFYFHYRHDTASMEVWDATLDFRGPLPETEDLRWVGEHAAWTKAEAESMAKQGPDRLILDLWRKYSSEVRAK